MPIYIYSAKKGPKETVQGEVEAVSQEGAVTKLEGMGLIPVNVIAKPGTGPTPEQPITEIGLPYIPSSSSVFFGFGHAKTHDIDTFTRQLASLIKAGVPVVRALGLISQQTENRELKHVVSDLEKEVKDGKMLSQAMGKYRKLFDRLYFSMINSGEKGGVLDETLVRLADYREKENELRRKVQAALAYPALITIVGIGTVFTILTFFLPKLTGLFGSMKQTIPLPTKILIGLSSFFSANWHWILIALALAVAVCGRVKPGSKKKLIFDVIKLRTPYIKKFVMYAEIAKFTKTLGLLLGSGIPIHESMDLARGTLDNDALRDTLGAISQAIIRQGASLSGSLRKIDVFPPFVTNMIAVGEEGGRLEESLLEISSNYEKEVEQAIKITTGLLEPFLILAIGIVVGFIVFAMLLPIFNIGIMGR